MPALIAEFNLDLAWLLAPVVALVVRAAVGLLVGLLWGLGLLTSGVRRRHLFWTAPPAALVAVGGWVSFGQEGGLTAAVEPPEIWLTAGSLLLAMISGLVGAVAMLPLRTMYQSAAGTETPDGTPEERVARLLEKPAARTPWPSFCEGFTAAFDGFRYLCYRPRLWRYGLLPIVINLMLVLAVVLVLLVGGWLLADWFHSLFPQGSGWLVVEIALVIVLIAAACGLALITWKLLEGVLCGHFYARLARYVELDLGTPAEELGEISLGYQIYDTARDVLSLVMINAGFLMLNVVPVLGSLVGFCLAFYFDCLVFGRDYFDFPLSLRGKRRAEKLAFAKAHRAHTFGLGAAVLLCNFIPIVGSVILTTAAAGAVLLHHRIERDRG